VQFALYVPNFGDYGDARRLAQLARAAEEAGWDGFFMWDHIARPLVTEMVDPWIALAAIAVSTHRIKIGALVTPLPRRRPWKVARETASLDQLSGGRLVFGAGTGSDGGRGAEWASFGEQLDPRTRGAMLDEGLEILSGLWSGAPFQFRGKHYHVEDALFLPRPVQSPRIPIWVAGYWPNKPPFRRAARWDGVFPLARTSPFVPPEQIREIVAYVRAQRAEAKAFDVVVTGITRDQRSDSERVMAAHAAGASWWLERLHSERGSLEQMHQRVRQGPPRVEG
jgi:alkanesulfonate monooxygenase SsuD/methylene tetrahydromethanopterin reductase-like flavin-dependent oxidoreductase (luciferase family)